MAAALPITLTCAAVVLHLIGERRAAIITGRPRDRAARTRSLCFYAGLLTVLIALATPLDALAEQLFWVHMVQHVLLLTVAPPLIVLGAPWMSLWRPVPLPRRRSIARTLTRSPACAPVRAFGRWLARPSVALVIFSVDLAVWHLPAAYDLALRSGAVHALEHASFLLVGILLWVHLLDSPPLRIRQPPAARAYLTVGAMVVCWAISLVLALAPAPIYPAYANLAQRPGGISALVDQQLAAGVMLVPGSLTLMVYGFVAVYRWLGQDSDDVLRRRRYHRVGAGAGGGT